MFLTELSPLMKELTQQPVAFMGGFVSGLLKLNLNEDPIKTWLTKQGIDPVTTTSTSAPSNGPQSISID
ncbi:hypothetical protein [Alkalinema sp. FACHB-956]|uniref:hypothetical protein n=1 Tax=Alkalinema sp. FACHB-956 TaxID=2692768 RepID=UPI001689AE00|nr:hypothetical protein [Alkalinema sp. FACHB-956]MBD2325946.1 hypothetical protein [Alkalinema sp. FACHB-956]